MKKEVLQAVCNAAVGDQGFHCSHNKNRQTGGQLAVTPIKKGQGTGRHTLRVSVDCLKTKPSLLSAERSSLLVYVNSLYYCRS